MTSKIYSANLHGLDAQIIQIETDIRKGKNKFNIVGLPDKAVSESSERIISALNNSGFGFPKGTVTVNLAPANIPKTGSVFDVAIAVGVLIEKGIAPKVERNNLFLGELSLDGNIELTNGVLTIISGAKLFGFDSFYIPLANAKEASLVDQVENFAPHNLKELIEHLNKNHLNKIEHTKVLTNTELSFHIDMKQIKGQNNAKRALEIASAGSHNCILSGVPGSGKTMLARALQGILPHMSFREAIDVTKIYSISGLLDSKKPLITDRPFRSPHHTSSQVSLVGGGSTPKPGEVTLAHNGVLFLDEFTEFPTKSLEALRQPLEDLQITISRVTSTVAFPADFMLVAAMNPCKCGFLGDPDKECICSQAEILRYRKKLSGPILDRIDLQVNVPKVKTKNLMSMNEAESSVSILKRVQKAREIQLLRFKESRGSSNSTMNQKDIREHIHLEANSLKLIKTAINNLNLSARSYYRILKVSRTIADLEESEAVKKNHIAEAIGYRF